jgi:hypothetical protein
MLILAVIVLSALGCHREAEPTPPPIPVPTDVSTFHSRATAGPANERDCNEAGGTVISFEAIDFGPGVWRRSRSAESPPVQFVLAKNVDQGLFAVRELSTGRYHLAVAFTPTTPPNVRSIPRTVSACLWST